MEMHQVKYFLAVARVLNFTRAAEECNVAQPSLTRAIKQLEEEFGGELFRRERNLTHLSDLGHRMLPLMQQCFDSAQSAKQMATSIKKGAIAPLALGLSSTINIGILVPFLTELMRVFPGLELRFCRGDTPETAERLKKGDVDLAIAGPFPEAWDRLEAWALFTEPYKLAVSKESALAPQEAPIALASAGKLRLLSRVYCEHASLITAFLKSQGINPELGHKVESESDLLALLKANIGVGVVPASSASVDGVVLKEIKGFDATRTVSVYAVAGRQRSTPANTLIKMLRAADWSEFDVIEKAPQKARAG